MKYLALGPVARFNLRWPARAEAFLAALETVDSLRAEHIRGVTKDVSAEIVASCLVKILNEYVEPRTYFGRVDRRGGGHWGVWQSKGFVEYREAEE